jgi:hypothetical protein
MRMCAFDVLPNAITLGQLERQFPDDSDRGGAIGGLAAAGWSHDDAEELLRRPVSHDEPFRFLFADGADPGEPLWPFLGAKAPL